ncbi:subtilisin inhibitor-like [Lentzea atacamensis]|uniref:Subtilisin inhibitor-like n=1 Tax=Lentzea atacamensis TaxID=531938 RepID=A0ABX9EBE6_9PSEU|nr:SSI family serine proteinase inhibitor [Lentzea atacamensis]RAS66849.1 subtilisin inhibitor-like [Lentzea atacamensis]
MFGRFFAIVAVLASLFTFAGTAQAAPTADRGTALLLTVQYSEVEGNAFKATLLTCEQGDRHPLGARACATLSAVGADLQAMGPDGRACTFIYAPVEVTMFGFWRGEPVSQVQTYPNSCVMQAHTGAVFDF